MESHLTVSLVCEFEPLRVGLARMIEESPTTRLGAAVDRVSKLGAVFERQDVVFIVESGHIPELLRFEAEQGGQALQRVVFVGPLPGEEEAGVLIATAVASRTAVAFLGESGRFERLLEAIGLVASGAFVCEMAFIRQLRPRDTDAEVRGKLTSAHLSPREQDVLLFVARGMANKEIARELHLAEGTVKAHVSHILNKLGVATRVDLVRYALLLSDGVDRSTDVA